MLRLLAVYIVQVSSHLGVDACAAVIAEWVPVCQICILYYYFTVSTEALLLPILTPEMGEDRFSQVVFFYRSIYCFRLFRFAT